MVAHGTDYAMKTVLLTQLMLAVVGVCSAVNLESICGMAQPGKPAKDSRTPRIETYILGGIGTTNREFPWIVSLRIRREGNVVSGHFCAGSIISENVVVTAAHCVEGTSESRLVIVYPDQEGILTMKLIARIVMHPKYDTRTNDYDIAVLVLRDKLNFHGAEANLRPICLPQRGDQVEEWPSCMVAGWGTLTFGDRRGSRILLKTDVQIVERDLCRRSYMSQNAITTRMFCAGDYLHGNKGTCQGDSGGPLMCYRDDFRYQLSGVTSWGLNCGKAMFPGVFTDVEKVLDFIVKEAKLTL